MCKKIKALDFVLENCEGVKIPIECFEKLSINNCEDLTQLKDKDDIIHMNCIIKDNGNISYSQTWGGNTVYPIDRLVQYNDITQLDIIYEDDSKVNLGVIWFNNGFCISNDNKNQQSKKEEFNTIHIKIEPYIEEKVNEDNFETAFKLLCKERISEKGCKNCPVFYICYSE